MENVRVSGEKAIKDENKRKTRKEKKEKWRFQITEIFACI